jgi:uncharacterized protein (TIGR02452 family)
MNKTMKQSTRIETARRTLEIVEKGQYEHNSAVVSVKSGIKNTIEKTYTIVPDDWEKILEESNEIKASLNLGTITKIWNDSTIKALENAPQGLKTAVLNFASAKNPGGGFLGGASAQEESLARSSSLYASQTKDWKMYHYNRGESTFLYSDYMIYSPETLFWFDDGGNTFAQPLIVDVITSPAPNKGAMLQHDRQGEISQIEKVFKSRIEKVLALAVVNKIETIILGAWGCGVFRNESADVANYFKEVIQNKFKNSFKEIIFAIYDSSEKKANFKTFEEILM